MSINDLPPIHPTNKKFCCNNCKELIKKKEISDSAFTCNVCGIFVTCEDRIYNQDKSDYACSLYNLCWKCYYEYENEIDVPITYDLLELWKEHNTVKRYEHNKTLTYIYKIMLNTYLTKDIMNIVIKYALT